MIVNGSGDLIPDPGCVQTITPATLESPPMEMTEETSLAIPLGVAFTTLFLVIMVTVSVMGLILHLRRRRTENSSEKDAKRY